MRDTVDEIVVDADGHLCEPADLWERNLPAGLRDQGIRLRWNDATGYDECWVEDRMATDPGVVDELREQTETMEPSARAGLFGRNALAMYGIHP